MDIKNFQPRSYQENISKTNLQFNTLVVLPTGLGKTKTAILTTIERLKLFPNSQILFLTPTKPLAAQIQKEYIESTTIQEDLITLFTGEVAPNKREQISKESKIIVSTPQTIANDIINSRINLENVSLLILDEAHRCVKDYDYTWICEQYNKTSKYPRIIGLTASPGSELAKIKEVCKNAFIEKIEVRSTLDEDVKPYVQEINIDWIKVNLPEKFKEIKVFLDSCFETKISQLRALHITQKNTFTKKELLGMMGGMQARIARGEKDFRMLRGVSIIAEAIKVQHAQELLETQGVKSSLIYMENLFKESEKTKVKSVKNLVKDLNFHSAYIKLKKLKDVKHPKLIKLIEVIKKEYNPNFRCIIFNQYRDQAKVIEEELNKIKGIKPKLFVGQAKKAGTGLSQKKQLELIEELREKKINVLISTNIGEEGLDIPKVDLVIFFEPVPSAIRSIQRRGRTARTEKGKVIILMTKNTRDEAYHWVSHHKENQMHKILKKLQSSFELKDQKSLKEFNSESNPLLIYADTRETKSPVLKRLKDEGFQIKTEQLETGDYIISDKIAIERKTPKDLINSILDKRIFSQIKKLRENYPKPLLIIEGEEDIYSIRKIHPNAIMGVLSKITLTYHVPIVYTKNAIETANLLKVILNQETSDKKEDYPIRIEKKAFSTQEQQEFIIESLPGVGPMIAKSLLKRFKTIHNIINSTTEQLKEIEGVGKKKAEEIIRILKEEY